MSPVTQILLPGENSAICSTYSSVLGHMTSELLHCQALAMKNSTVIGKNILTPLNNVLSNYSEKRSEDK